MSKRPSLSKSSMMAPPARVRSGRPDSWATSVKCGAAPASASGDADQVVGRHRVRVLAERHVGDVQQPARLEVLRVLRQRPGEVLDGARGPGLVLVHAAPADREDAPLGVVVREAVLQFATPEVGDGNRQLERVRRLAHGRIGRHQRRDGLVRLVERLAGAGHLALIGVDLPERAIRPRQILRVARPGRRRRQPLQVAPGSVQGRGFRLQLRVADGLEVLRVGETRWMDSSIRPDTSKTVWKLPAPVARRSQSGSAGVVCWPASAAAASSSTTGTPSRARRCVTRRF